MTDETLQREIAGTMLPNDEFALAYPESVPDTCEMDAAVLIEAVVECLWRLYGYEPGIDGRHPETERVFRLDAVSLIEGIERAGYRIVAADRWERVRDVAERSACIQRHKAEVFGRDTVSLPDVEQLNEHLKAIYAQLDAAYLRLQPGDLDPMPMGGE
jgi:hypothetical protein